MVMREERRFNVLCCGRRWGKTILGEDRLIHPAIAGFPVAYFSPTYKMMAEVWRDVRRILLPVTAAVDKQQHRIELLTGGVVDMWSLDAPNTARGRKYKRVVVDEAAMVPDLENAWQAVIRPTLADYRGDAWLQSTPKGRNYFSHMFLQGRNSAELDWVSWQMPTAANPYIDAAEIAAMQRDMPETTFAQEVLAQFVEAGSNSFLSAWWDDQNRYHIGDTAHINRTIARYISWDTGFKDKDSNAYSAAVVFDLLPDYRLLVREVWRDKLTFPNLVPEIERLAYKHNRDEKLRGVIIEDRASGISAIQTLRQSGPPWLAPLLIPFEPKGDKRQRGEQAAVWCRLNCVWFPHPADEARWLMAFEDELYSAPDATFMDQHDAFAQGILYLENLISAGHAAREGRTGAA